MAKKVTVAIEKEISKYVATIQRQQGKNEETVVAELLREGFEAQVKKHYEEYRQGRISLRHLAKRLGVEYRELYDLLEEQRLPF